MKIGTKTNAIDDLGKLDTSKTTIKVNGKQIYSQKRYAIVRVDNSCPAMSADFGCIVARNMFHCKCGEDTKNYGDTKEQLIAKVKQALQIGYNKGIILSDTMANFIVEFLGVKDE